MRKEINFNNVNKILVVMLGGIGNLILVIPGLRALKNAFPDKKIVLLTGEPHVEDVIQNDHLIDEVRLLDLRKKQTILNKMHFVWKLRKEHYGLAIVGSCTNAFNASVMTFLMDIPYRVGEDIKGKGLGYTHKIEFKKDTHECDGISKLVESIGIHVNEKVPTLSVSSADEDFIKDFLAAHKVFRSDIIIGIQTGSGYRQTFKRWPKERFAQLADHLIEHYKAKVILVGGPQERILVEEITRIMKHSPVKSAGLLSITQTTALINQCNLFISNDSGLAHIAAAVKTPLIVLFGGTDVNRIAPRGDQVRIIRKQLSANSSDPSEELINLIQVDEVLSVIDSRLNAMRYAHER